MDMTWHALLGPLPPGATPTRQPLAPPDILATPEGASIAGWTQLVLHLSAGCDGLRTVLVVIDEKQLPISASDGVVYRREGDADGASGGPGRVHFRHETIGGRFEPDGRFRGRHWMSESTQTRDGVDETAAPPTGRDPTADEVHALKALVAEVMRRHTFIEGNEHP
jgi:hypothetical protein